MTVCTIRKHALQCQLGHVTMHNLAAHFLYPPHILGNLQITTVFTIIPLLGIPNTATQILIQIKLTTK